MESKRELVIKGKFFSYTTVLSRNIITDWVQGIRNTLGVRLHSYEEIINEGTNECFEKMQGLKVKWYRLDTEFSEGMFLIKVYGELK